MHYPKSIILTLLLLFVGVSCEQERTEADYDRESITIFDQVLLDVQYLASDKLEGRRTGSEGNRLAQEYITERFENLGLQTFGEDYRHTFDHTNESSGEVFEGAVNLIGYVEGTEFPDRYIVVAAHYDHLGVQDGEIYNGADDNASGTGGLMASAEYFTRNHPENSILFIALDAEEQGLGGAHHFVENPVVPLGQIIINVNMDMISTNFENELYAVGTYHYPYLKPMVEELTASAPIDVPFGYDSDEWDQNWTTASDHGPFHQKGVPFIYFGVEDHSHYHAPTDVFENINQDFYQMAVATIINVIEGFDERLDKIVEHSGR